MGLLDALFDPTKNTEAAFGQAAADFNRTRSLTDPFFQDALTNGANANSLLGRFLGLAGVPAQRDALGSFVNSPAFDFNFRQGQRAIDQSAAARGLGQSGSTLKSLQQFGQGLQANEFNNRISQLSRVGQTGFQGAAGLTGNSQNSGNLAISLGQAQDAGNQASFGNILGLGSTLASFATGVPTGGGNGRIF